MWVKVALAGLAASGAIALGTWIGALRQQSALSILVERLLFTTAQYATELRFDELNNLPAPVARYLKQALPAAMPIRLARFSQVGSLRTDVRSDRWMPFEARYLVAPSSIGFLWDARVTVAPLLHVRVRDALIEGRGSGRVSLLSAFTVAANGGTREINSGSLHRFLAEAVWYPTALLPSPWLHWEAIDSNKALATLTHSDVTVSLEFRFAESGEVTAIYTPDRWGSFDGGYKQLPWEGHFSKYEHSSGMLVPTEGEVGWYYGRRWQAVWKGRITAMSYVAK
jgi:hypothetical protein